MAHVHGAAGAAKTAMDQAMMGPGMGAMGSMMKGMEPMMEGMAAGHRMANLPMNGANLAKGAAAAVAATSPTGRSFMSILGKHPLLVFGLGLATGYFIHKYRKEIIGTATRVTEQGKDFVLHQKENLEDLVAECKECADDEGEAKEA